ncbi:hypothetical protein [Fodinibius sp. Rm-B-1B1-1]|uniref:hypothetical protein n=1 Tax=Fodinibius alkaliphilus TaxID=3140241 RepID=UPI00315ABBCD
MTSKEQPLSKKQSLGIINEMIQRAKGEFKESAFYFLLWGWVIIAGSISHFVLLQYSSFPHPEWAWAIIIIGIVASFTKGIRDKELSGATTYSSHIHTTVWTVFMINYFIVLFFISEINSYITPLILIMAASSTYLSGAIIKFRPLKWGAGFIWLMGVLSFMISLPHQLLTAAAAVFVGYLVPGYILKNNEE